MWISQVTSSEVESIPRESSDNSKRERLRESENETKREMGSDRDTAKTQSKA